MDISQIKAAILVGGLGTRLRSVVSDVPKPMAPINDKPFLFYKLDRLKKFGVNNIVFCSGYLHNIIESYFKDGSEFGLSIEYSVEKERLGTAGAIKQAENFLTSDFFMMNGDVYTDANLIEMVQFHEKNQADVTMLLTPVPENSAGGIVLIDEENNIKNFVEKPTEEYIRSLKNPYINAGIYLINPKILKMIPAGKKYSIEKEIFPKLIENGSKFMGFPYNGYFIDIGVPENYKRFIDDVVNKNI